MGGRNLKGYRDFALKTEFSDHNPLYAELDESVDVGSVPIVV